MVALAPETPVSRDGDLSLWLSDPGRDQFFRSIKSLSHTKIFPSHAWNTDHKTAILFDNFYIILLVWQKYIQIYAYFSLKLRSYCCPKMRWIPENHFCNENWNPAKIVIITSIFLSRTLFDLKLLYKFFIHQTEPFTSTAKTHHKGPFSGLELFFSSHTFRLWLDFSS